MSDESNTPPSTGEAPRSETIVAAKALGDQKVVDQMQADITALLQSWVDRGIPPDEGAQVMAATAHLMLCMHGYGLASLICSIARQWDLHGGKS